jgi:hypothetical protein
MREIFLTQNQVALVDDENYEYLNQFKWYADKPKTSSTFYVRRTLPKINGKRPAALMHHEVIGRPPKGFEVDHRNGQGTDNQRHNLRFVTKRGNAQNRKSQKSSSRYPGVCWHKTGQKWQAHIRINGHGKYLGLFNTEKEAFEAYEQAVNGLGEKIIEGIALR